MRLCSSVVVLFLFAAAAASASINGKPHLREDALRAAARKHTLLKGSPTTVKALNVSEFLGRWYEVMQDFATAATFQQNSFCAIAEYGVDPTDTSHVTVFNWEHYGSETGAPRNVTGYAYQPNATTEPGQLIVYLHGQNASPFPAPYWVLRLGDVVNGVYDFAIVSDSLRLTLFVLARDVARFEREHRADVLAWLANNGFDQFWNSPIDLPQGGNCTYPPAQ